MKKDNCCNALVSKLAKLCFDQFINLREAKIEETTNKVALAGGWAAREEAKFNAAQERWLLERNDQICRIEFKTVVGGFQAGC